MRVPLLAKGFRPFFLAAGVYALIAMVLSLIFGLIFSVGRLSDHWWIGVPAGVVVEFFRAVPVLLLGSTALAAVPDEAERGRLARNSSRLIPKMARSPGLLLLGRRARHGLR